MAVAEQGSRPHRDAGPVEDPSDPQAAQIRRSGKRAPAGARLGEESPRIGPRFFEPGELYAMSAGHLMTPGPASRDLQSDSADTMLATRPLSAKPA
jgi:hypothetical protein